MTRGRGPTQQRGGTARRILRRRQPSLSVRSRGDWLNRERRRKEWRR